VPVSPAFAEDEDVIAYNEAFELYGKTITETYTPHCAWSYAEGAILEQAFLKMTEPTRDNFLEALHSIEDFKAPLLLDGITVNTTDPTLPAIQGINLVQFNGTGYGPVQ
jgi:branched-chain amino acid transport system substrate-binding protein